MVTIGALDDEQQQQHAERDAGVGEVEGGPAERELDEVGDRARAETVENVAERAAEQHAGGEPDQGLVAVAGEVDEQHEQREPDEQRDRDADEDC